MMPPPKHPDTRLLELGQQFEDAKAEHRRAWRLRSKLYNGPRDAAYAAAWEATVKTTDAPIRRALAIAKAIYREKPTTMEGVSVKLAAIVFDMSDLVFDPAISDFSDGLQAERELVRLRKQVDGLLKDRRPGRVAELYSKFEEEEALINVDGLPEVERDARVLNNLAPIQDELLDAPAYTLQEFAMKVRVADPLLDALKDEMDALIRGEVWRP